MSFNWYARKVRNPRLTIWTRRSAFYSCVLRYCWLTHQPYLKTRTALTAQFGLDYPTGPNEHALLDALDTLERARHQFLEQLRAFERRRLRQKWYGYRSPRASDLQTLYAGSDALIADVG